MTQNKKGFTLIELMVVMAIIAVLAVLMVGAIQLARTTATETTHRTNAKTIQTALESQFARYRQYCGASGQAVTCDSGTTTRSFTTTAGSSQLNVTLGNASSTGTCASSGANDGGGRVHIESSSYKIIPVSSGCANTGTGTTVNSTGDLASDVLPTP